MIGIYKITSPSGKIYIGQAWNIKKRFQSYKCLNKASIGTHLYNSFLKHEVKNHLFEVIQHLPSDVEQEILDWYEIFYIQQYKECGFEMLNIKEGGSHGKHSEETKIKIGEKSKTKTKWVAKTNFLGCHHSKKHKLYMKNIISIPVNQFSLKGIFIKSWKSGKDASKKLNISAGNISSCCRGKLKRAGKFIWKYKIKKNK
jgi:group I intron endonuclease